MSLVYITFHTENVKDFDREGQHSFYESIEYSSRHSKKIAREKKIMHIIDLGDNKKLITNSAKYKHRTMGCAEGALQPPCNFLRKNQGITWKRYNDHKCPPKKELQPMQYRVQLKKPCVSNIEKNVKIEESKKAVCSKQDFVTLNIAKVKNAKAKVSPPRYIDTPTGDCHNLLNTGLIPQYICSKNFGKVPCYLKARKKFLHKLNEQYKELKNLQEKPCAGHMNEIKGLKKLSKEERQEILTGLRKNFAEVFKIYNGLSLYTDTAAKKMRKAKLEGQLRQLEQDIFLMESNPDIYVNEY